MGADVSTEASPPVQITSLGGQPVRCACTALNKAFTEVIPAAYHTSIAIGDTEYSFGPSGIVPSRAWLSHSMIKPGVQSPEIVLFMGSTNVQGVALTDVLEPYFMPGTYDLLLKNCNAFSNAALFFLLGTQLEAKYTALDRAGAAMDKTAGLVQLLSMGNYIPNPKAVNFELPKVLSTLQSQLLQNSVLASGGACMHVSMRGHELGWACR
eukprot:TRINITY_DN19309_c0_g1_i2.p1 TRINITY_DN19309_c0_g1~~TRINITY_DN19309_c0_g1_i2.p1  ORF type:complete len:210 (+),score=24.89 TRINITY_DN19309_c0_g1_i2:90-719(+)